MNSIYFFIFSFLLSFCSIVLAKNNGESHSTTRAVIIGISEYKVQDRNLNYSDDDALAMYDYFISQHEDNSKLGQILINNNATYSNIESAISRIDDNSEPQDTIIFYFSGHGNNKAKLISQGF